MSKALRKPASKPAKLRCAVYTRKSSEEGLDQSFNSLDAQRQAGEAYVKSQSCEGWKVVPTQYDDGGYSGGTMERPGLQHLLADIDAGLVDVVVVYKIDRLTRSLPDFARIVERFDARGVSFVSVTQAFNTTSSMGRLTLNVLLSFAQFEREVTGERIRDKIAASKARGMWMGGVLPLGFDLPAAGTRTLLVNDTEAATVRHIFERYLALGSVHQLERELLEQGVLSKRHVTRNGKPLGGKPFSRGALFHLLRNRIYLGKIVHRGTVHEGEHDAILGADLFERVGALLDAQARRHRVSSETRMTKAPLTAKLFDATGEPMSPTFSQGRSGRLYRYYVSASLQQGAIHSDDGVIRRLPAPDIERVVAGAVQRWLRKADQPLEHVRAVRLCTGGLSIDLPVKCSAELQERLGEGERMVRADRKTCTIHLPVSLPLRGGRRLVIPGERSSSQPDKTLISALRKAHRMITRERGMPLIVTSPVICHDRKIVRLAFLAPELQRDILAGRQPPLLNLEALMKMHIPLAWNEQRVALGWPDCQQPCSGE